MGIRELRDTLTQTLRRVRDEGETIEVTLDGEPIATIAPVPKDEDRLDRLVRLGLARPARHPRFRLDRSPAVTGFEDGLTSEQIISEDRGD
jgi:antitoxin (DNA-binding transcriptional repressor) of toxin-antitoxin stability system